jgi:peroxiredoxin
VLQRRGLPIVALLAILALIVSVDAAAPTGAAQATSLGGKPAPSLIGKPAPAFALKDITGAPLTLADYRGKVVLIDFWATWCVPCREEIPHFVQLQTKYARRGFSVIGISMDDAPEPVPPFARKYGMNYPVALGSATLAERYGGVLGLPVAFVVDRDGRIRYRYDGVTSAQTFETAVVTLLAK